MGRTCVVAGCINARKHPIGTIHGFPKENVAKNKWIKSIGTAMKGNGNLKIENHGICSLHFEPDDYIIEPGARMQLKYDVVPVIQRKLT